MTDQPTLSEVLDAAVPFALPLRRRFRGLDVREGVLIKGPSGWGEFAPFDDYSDTAAARWLDSAIEAAELNDLAGLRRIAPGLEAVAHNGAESARTMRRLQALGFAVHRLPSTSPANAGWSFERKLAAWRETFARYDLA